MSACYTSCCPEVQNDREANGASPSQVLVTIDDELLAAVEGWRQAHALDQPEAIGQLIRLGLLSEIAKIYRLVSDKRHPSDNKVSERKPRKSNGRHQENAQSLAN